MMAWETMRDIIDLAGRSDVEIIDIAGGSPEEHRHLKRFIKEVTEERKHLMVRTDIAWDGTIYGCTAGSGPCFDGGYHLLGIESSKKGLSMRSGIRG